MEELLKDVRYALRSLRKSPGFTTVAVLTLALGIGANSAIFSVLNGVVLRPLPYAQPEALVRIHSKFTGLGFEKFWISPPEYFELEERSRTLSSFGGYRTNQVSIGGDDAPIRATSASATASLFPTLGVQPVLGRWYTAEEDVPNGEPVVMLSYEFWQRAFGGDRNILSRPVMVNGVQARVSGVMPAGFDVADAKVEVWRPMQLDRANRQNRGSHFLEVVARLKPGATMAQAENELAANVSQWQKVNPNSHTPDPQGHPMFMLGMQEDLVGGIKPALIMLLGAVGFVLLIACANVANLLLARAEGRQKEIAVRAALGAGRWRLISQFLTEGVVLSLIGGTLGLFLGHYGVKLLLATSPNSIPRATSIGLDTLVILFTLAISVVTGLIFGLAPMMHLRARTVNSSLREGGARTTAAGTRKRIRQLLVISETALAVVLVVGSGLMLRSFAALQQVDPGFKSDNLLTFQLFLPAANYADPAAQTGFFNRLLPELKALPGVVNVSAMNGMPPRRDVNANDTEFEGLPQGPGTPPQNVDYWQFIERGYLETMGIPLIQGRDFSASDINATSPVVLVNEALVRKFYPNTNPIGRRVRPPGPPDNPQPWFTIVGVVKDVKQGGLEAETGTELYFLYPQVAGALGFAPRAMNIAVRTRGEPMSMVNGVRQQIASIDPTLPLANVASMNEVLHESVARPRFLTALLAIFAIVALALAAIGTYGVMSYSVQERRQEIGIRMALGAESGGVMKMIVGQGFGVAALGLVIGTGGALALTRLMQTMLYGVSATDTVSFISAPLVLALVALAACWIPARRATTVDPAIVLKPE